MSRLLKILLALAAIIILLFLGVAVAVLLLVDPNDYRDEIAAAVSEQTGREFTIDGELGLRVLPCCAVAIDDTRLGNPSGFDDPDFASVRSVRLGLQLLPLLFDRRLVIDEVTLDGLSVRLLRRKDGTANWEFDLGEPAEAPEPEPEAAGEPLPELSVAGLRITDARIELQDEQAGMHVAVEALNVTTGPVAADAPIDLELSLRAKDYDSDAALTAELGGGLMFAADAAAAELTGLESRLEITSPDLPGGSAVVALRGAAVRADLNSGITELDGISAAIDAAGLRVDVQAKGSAGAEQMALSGTVTVPRFSPRELLARLGEPPIETADPAVLDAAEIEAGWSLDTTRLEVDSLQAQLDDSRLTGKLGTNYADLSNTRFDIAIDAIDADRYLAPAPAETEAAAAPTSVEEDLPVDTLRELDAVGKAKIGQLKIAGLTLQNVTASVDARKGLIVIDPSSADVYGGRYLGAIRLDVTGDVPALKVSQSLDAVQAGGILADLYEADNLQGLVQARVEGTGRGRNTTELMRGLKGTVSLDLDEAVYKGADVWYEIRKSVALLKGKPPPAVPADPQTQITALGFAGQLADGVLRSERLVAEIPFIRVQGSGNFNLLENNLDYRLQARMLSRPNFPDAEDLADLERITIPITVKGAADAPKIGIDLQELAKDAAVQKVQDRLLKKLGLDEPEASSESPPAGDTATEEQPAEPAEPPDERDEARDLLKKGLRDLLGRP